jgi:hypothetical protein
MDQVEKIAKRLKLEGLIATWAAIIIGVWVAIILLAASERGSNITWSNVTPLAYFLIGLFAYGHLTRKVAQIANSVSPSK